MIRSAHRRAPALSFLALVLSIGIIGLTPSLPPSYAQPASLADRVVRERADGRVETAGDAGERAARPGRAALPSQTCAAPAPTLVAPINGVTSNDLENPRYTWTVVPTIREYVFQLALDSAFSQLLTTDQEFANLSKQQVTAATTYDLDTTTTYFWRVASVCDDGQIGAFSSPASFTTGDGNPGAVCTLPPPALLEPASGTQVPTLVPRIVWNREPATFEYFYQLATDSAFTQFVDRVTFLGIDPELSSDIIEIPSDNLTPDTVYYWRVASVCADIDATGSFSAPFSFRAGPAGGAFLPPPVLVAPADGATTGSIRVTFLYGSVPDAEVYRVRLYRTRADAEQDNWFRGLSTASTTRVEVFSPQTTFYWRASTRSAYGWGALSEIRSFTTPTVSASATLSPENGGTLRPEPGYLTATFPPGAVTSPTNLSFRLLSTPQQRLPNARFANRAFTLEAFAGDQRVTQFAKPFTLVITYDPSDLLAAGIGDPSQLTLVFWNGTTWESVLPCAGCSVDTTARTVTVVLDHLTEFALIAPGTGVDVQRVFLPVVRS